MDRVIFLSNSQPLAFAGPHIPKIQPYQTACVLFSSVLHSMLCLSVDQLGKCCTFHTSRPPPHPILIYQSQQTPAQGHPSVRPFLTPVLSDLILWLTPPFTLYGLILAYFPTTRPWTWFMGSVSLYWPTTSLKVVNIHLFLWFPAQYLTHSRCSISNCWTN